MTMAFEIPTAIFPLDLFDDISPEEIPEDIPSKLHP